MKTTIKTFLGAACLAIGLFSSQPTASAVAITGEIDFGGTALLDSSLDTATQVTTFYNVFGAANTASVLLTSGSFTSIANGSNAVFASPYIFNPSTPTPNLWSVGGFTFDLTSSSIISQSATFLNITGSGVLSGNGYDATIGAWSFTITNASGGDPATGRFGFNASNAALPDGGTTVALLGLSLVLVEAGRRALGVRSASIV